MVYTSMTYIKMNGWKYIRIRRAKRTSNYDNSSRRDTNRTDMKVKYKNSLQVIY